MEFKKLIVIQVQCFYCDSKVFKTFLFEFTRLFYETQTVRFKKFLFEIFVCIYIPYHSNLKDCCLSFTSFYLNINLFI